MALMQAVPPRWLDAIGFHQRVRIAPILIDEELAKRHTPQQAEALASTLVPIAQRILTESRVPYSLPSGSQVTLILRATKDGTGIEVTTESPSGDEILCDHP